VKISEAVKNGKSHKGKTYDEIYGDRAQEEREKRKMAGWGRAFNEEQKIILREKIKNTKRQKSKYNINVINEIKKLLQDGKRVVDIHKLFPTININTIYCIKQGRRWKD
jgi:predicted site-specific integrase-resolvase